MKPSPCTAYVRVGVTLPWCRGAVVLCRMIGLRSDATSFLWFLLLMVITAISANSFGLLCGW